MSIDLSTKQIEKLERAFKLEQGGLGAFLETIDELEDKMEEIKGILEGKSLIKGDKGEQGEAGIDGVDGKNGIDGKDGKNGKDGKDGRDGQDGLNGKDGVDGKDGQDGKDGDNIEGKEIVRKINDLPLTPDEKIDARHIKNLPMTMFAGNSGAGSGGSSAYVRNSYSARYSELVDFATVEEALDYIFNFSYVAPAITLSANPTSTIKEFGDPITSIDFTAVTTKTSNPITSVAFYRGASLIDTVASPDHAGGTELYTETDDVTATTSFTAKVGDGTQTTTSNTITYTFVYPFYSGVGAQALTPAQIQALTKTVKAKSNTTTITSPTNEVFYLAYPASYGSLTSILDTNGFETLSSYTVRTENFTMLDASVVSYKIYELNGITTQVLFTNQYIF